ncbi:MAG: FAD-binding protein [Coriobacteriales bacterium]|jgi:succinate dehydrogenase/fumarate reductase flavoprotein subunit|nr:FAD-binding protein [Coriobacteriales bacterium]
MEIKEKLSRRSFIKGAGLLAVGAATTGMVGCGNTTEGDSWVPEWTDEADLIVIGYGGAGAMAAIAGLDAGASVIVLEKSSERDGGNTGCSTGSIHRCMNVDLDEWWSCVKHGAFGTLKNDDDIKSYLAASQNLPEWFERFGINVEWADTTGDGHKYPKKYQQGNVVGREGNSGMYLFEELNEVADGYGIDVRLSMRAAHLVRSPATKEVCGIIASDANGNEVAFKANKAVIMCCGGYENSPELQSILNYPGLRAYGWGTPNNEGDGFAIAQEVGADFWHTTGFDMGSSLCYKAPSEEISCAVSTDATNGINPYNYLIVDFNARRFMQEDKLGAHDLGHKNELDFDSKTADYKHLPFFLVFDQAFFDAKPLWIGTGRGGIINTYAGVANVRHPESPMLAWGEDNSKALANGWIVKADTIEGLAALIKGERPCKTESEAINGIDAEALARTVAQYNEYAVAGDDPDFGRDPEHMLPLAAEGPYYAIELGFTTINTWGGPVRNGSCQTMTAAYEPIPRLYNCGEFGSFDGYVYTIGNVLEALSTGVIAAQHAVRLESWDRGN